MHSASDFGYSIEGQLPVSTQRQLVAWLAGHGNNNATPCTVTIKGTTYQGASYRSPHHGNREFIYLLGERPACYLRSTKTAFRFACDARDWYIACYMPRERITPELAEFHPFGASFMLTPWEVLTGDAIDKYEPRPYARVPAILKWEA